MSVVELCPCSEWKHQADWKELARGVLEVRWGQSQNHFWAPAFCSLACGESAQREREADLEIASLLQLRPVHQFSQASILPLQLWNSWITIYSKVHAVHSSACTPRELSSPSPESESAKSGASQELHRREERGGSGQDEKSIVEPLRMPVLLLLLLREGVLCSKDWALGKTRHLTCWRHRSFDSRLWASASLLITAS